MGFNHVWTETRLDKVESLITKKRPSVIFVEIVRKGSLDYWIY